MDGKAKKTRFFQIYISVFRNDVEFSRTTEFGAIRRHNVELVCFPILTSCTFDTFNEKEHTYDSTRIFCEKTICSMSDHNGRYMTVKMHSYQ